MTPDERIMDTWQAELELRDGRELPWYLPTERILQQNANWAMGQFSWFVIEARRVGDAPEVWHEITTQLHKWYTHGAAH
jgi:hypothetical protein